MKSREGRHAIVWRPEYDIVQIQRLKYFLPLLMTTPL